MRTFMEYKGLRSIVAENRLISAKVATNTVEETKVKK